MASTALDATSLIYALDRKARRKEEQADCDKVHEFVNWLKANALDEIQIPAPAHGEFLAFYVGAEKKKELVSIIKRGFVITPYDDVSAFKAAEIWEKLGGPKFRKKMSKDFDISKQCVKTDIQIVATAIVHEASQIIAVDRGVLTIAREMGLKALTPAECILPVDKPKTRGKMLFEDPEPS